jgi:hypothetical protein
MEQKLDVPPTPTKPVLIEIIGGGDADGLYIDSEKGGVEAELVNVFWWTTMGGREGGTMMGPSVTNLRKVITGETRDPMVFARQTNYFTIIDRLEEPNQILLRLHYTAGRHEWPKKDDGTTPPLGWVNTALRKFLHASYEKLKPNGNTVFWISRDLQTGCACTIEKFVIEQGYRGGTLDEKCQKIVETLSRSEKFDATYAVEDDVVVFRPVTKANS